MFVWSNIDSENNQNKVNFKFSILHYMQLHLKDQLVELQLCLEALPTNIPFPKEYKYNFSNFSPDADWTADIGEVGAVN